MGCVLPLSCTSFDSLTCAVILFPAAYAVGADKLAAMQHATIKTKPDTGRRLNIFAPFANRLSVDPRREAAYRLPEWSVSAGKTGRQKSRGAPQGRTYSASERAGLSMKTGPFKKFFSGEMFFTHSVRSR